MFKGPLRALFLFRALEAPMLLMGCSSTIVLLLGLRIRSGCSVFIHVFRLLLSAAYKIWKVVMFFPSSPRAFKSPHPHYSYFSVLGGSESRVLEFRIRPRFGAAMRRADRQESKGLKCNRIQNSLPSPQCG